MVDEFPLSPVADMEVPPPAFRQRDTSIDLSLPLEFRRTGSLCVSCFSLDSAFTVFFRRERGRGGLQCWYPNEGWFSLVCKLVIFLFSVFRRGPHFHAVNRVSSVHSGRRSADLPPSDNDRARSDINNPTIHFDGHPFHEPEYRGREEMYVRLGGRSEQREGVGTDSERNECA